MRAREGWAYALLVLSLAWFAGPDEAVSRAMLDAQARESGKIQLEHLVASIALTARQAPERIPQEADLLQAQLSDVLALEDAKHQWVLNAYVGLDDAQIEFARSHRSSVATDRSRLHPSTPSEVIEIVRLVTEAHGSRTSEAELLDASLPWPQASPIDLVDGLLALVQEGPALDPLQAELVLGAAVGGMAAYEEQARLIAKISSQWGTVLLPVSAEVISHLDPMAVRSLGRHALALLAQAAHSTE
jgi:hypothetical protein